MSAAAAATTDARDGNTTPPSSDQLANAPTPDSAGQGSAAAKTKDANKQARKGTATSQSAGVDSAAEQKQKSQDDNASLLAKLRSQIEFYFSSQNLQNDPFLVSKMNAEKFVPISVIANFRKISELTTDVSLIAEAVRDSKVCSIDATGKMLKPTSMKFQERNTIILREVDGDATETELRALFSDTDGCGTVISVRSDIRNTWFITMESEEAARDSLLALKSSGKGFKGKPIRGGLKSKSVARSTFAPSSVDAPAFVPGQGFGGSAKAAPTKAYPRAAPQAPQLPPGAAVAMAQYYNMTPEQMKLTLATNPYFAAQMYAYTTMTMQGMNGGNRGPQQGGYRGGPYGNSKDVKYGNGRRNNHNSHYNQRGNPNSNFSRGQQGQQQKHKQNHHNNNNSTRKSGNSSNLLQNNKKQLNKKNKGSVGTTLNDGKPSKGATKATTAAAAAAAAAKKAASSKDGSLSSSSGGSSSGAFSNGSGTAQSRSNTKHNGRVAGVGRAPPNVGSTSHSSNSANASGLNNNSNKSVAGNNNSAKGAVSNNGSGNYTAKGVATDKKSKKAAGAEAAQKNAPVVPNVTSTSMFPSLGGKSGSVPAAVNAAATSLWSASAAVKQKPASSKLRQKPRPAADTSTDEAGKTSSGGKKKKGRGSSSASSKTGDLSTQASGESGTGVHAEKIGDTSVSSMTAGEADTTSSLSAPFSWAATVAKTANKPVREKKEKSLAKQTWASEASKKKKAKTPSSPNTKDAVSAIVDSVVDSVASKSGEDAPASDSKPSSVVTSLTSPTRKKSPVVSWADEADTDDEDDMDSFNFRGSGSSPKKSLSGGLAAALRSDPKPASVSPRRGWESASVTKHREQAVRASGEEVGSADASSSSSGKWADVVKRTDGSSPSGPSSSQYTSKARDSAWNGSGDSSGASTTTGSSERSGSETSSWGDRVDAPVLPVNTRAALFASATGAQPAKREPRDEENSLGGSR